LQHPVALVLKLFVHMCNHRLKCKAYYRLWYKLLQHVSAALGHHHHTEQMNPAGSWISTHQRHITPTPDNM
jgi:hypothetical protein